MRTTWIKLDEKCSECFEPLTLKKVKLSSGFSKYSTPYCEKCERCDSCYDKVSNFGDDYCFECYKENVVERRKNNGC